MRVKVRRLRVPFLLIAILVILVAIPVFFLTFRKNFSSCDCGDPALGEVYDPLASTAIFEGKEIPIPKIVFDGEDLVKVLGENSSEKWIEVDLSEQKIKAWEGDKLFLESLVSTGLPWFPTPKGEYRIWFKVRATKMEGGTGPLYYYLPNVPYVMFFENDKIPGWRGYSLHGTYWHNDFGRVHSHGCINLPTKVAERLYYWTTPVMPDGKNVVRSSAENIGTRIVIHD